MVCHNFLNCFLSYSIMDFHSITRINFVLLLSFWRGGYLATGNQIFQSWNSSYIPPNRFPCILQQLALMIIAIYLLSNQMERYSFSSIRLLAPIKTKHIISQQSVAIPNTLYSYSFRSISFLCCCFIFNIAVILKANYR